MVKTDNFFFFFEFWILKSSPSMVFYGNIITEKPYIIGQGHKICQEKFNSKSQVQVNKVVYIKFNFFCVCFILNSTVKFPIGL